MARAGLDFALGNAGAGLGAKAGRLKGGIGSASLRLVTGETVGALVAVNSWGEVVRPDCGRLWAADLALAGEIDRQPPSPPQPFDPEDLPPGAAAGANTTLAVVATDAPLDKSGCRRLAIMAQDGLARLGTAAADCLARAVMRAVLEAEPLGGLPSWRQRWGGIG